MWFSLKYSWTYSFASIFLDVVDLGWVNECTFFSKLFFDIILLESNRIFFITVVSWLNLVAPLLCNLTFIFINMIFFCLTTTIKILIQERKIRIKYLCNADGALHLKSQMEIGKINLKIFLKKQNSRSLEEKTQLRPHTVITTRFLYYHSSFLWAL